ncbi:sterol regulatory element-binding protein cleavage-activating protein [Condylostylus longicornis]|uniref:sterol regulatory element-binding protein cleavage-activating protein n=1 Tax=Condylostylus longicornis TaxID=2530218 RepID=UPI00244DC809|nr:sterol regulatory element-binding protein cleavage-activating protein [Condylostylus longicornis]
MTKDHKREKQALPEVVSQWYYKHGLFLSSYPTCSIGIAVIIFLISCYPLLNIPLPGTIPTKLVYTFESNQNPFDDKIRNFSLVKDIFNVNTSFDPPFQWAQNKPALYVQQILLRTGVHPWLKEMYILDAFRSPLYEVFKLLEIVRNHESSTNLDNICLHVDNVKRMKSSLFPEYNCLVLSPANFWNQDIHNFSKDGNILNSIFQHHSYQKGKVSVAEMLLGIPMQDTGLKRYPVRSRSRIIQYAITLVLKQYDKNFLKSLKNKLQSQYSLYQDDSEIKSKTSLDNPNEEIEKTTESTLKRQQQQTQQDKTSIMYIYYPGELKVAEFMPICIAFILLFIYVYFSVRKIDVIKSRFILATFAVFTVLGSLMMSIGLCFFFGLTISLQSIQSKGIFPYLVVLVGLENCLVLTKSIVSTDETFDNKIRVAQALSKEGWHISKTLLTEITILTAGLATFVPVIQEFCVFAIVGLISDFILQMLFFSTGLAMNIKRVEYQYEAKNLPKIMSYDHKQREFKNFTGYNYSPLNYNVGGGFHRSHSYPKLSLNEINKAKSVSENKTNKRLNSNNSQEQKIPKRLRIVNFWARTRFFQRAFMVWMSIWIFSIVYNSEFLEHFLVIDLNNSSSLGEDISVRNFDSKFSATQNQKTKPNGLFHVDVPGTNTENSFGKMNSFSETEEEIREQKKFKYPDYEINYYLSNFHWSEILIQYNISLAETYIAVLPSIKLSKIIAPESAIIMRNPKDVEIKNFQWKTLAAALDPLDFNDEGKNIAREKPVLSIGTTSGTPLYPKSPMEIFIVAMLCSISIFVLTYTMVVFYRCICTRNYAEWRSSWNETEPIPNAEQILEGVPLHLPGHTHKIECLVSDGQNIISCCLKGQIKVWDVECGDLLLNIDRSKYQEILNSESQMRNFINNTTNNCGRISKKRFSPIWCMDYLNNIVALGCANGRIEFWEIPTGILKCAYEEEDKEKKGITHITLVGDRVIAAKLSGRLDFYRLETYYKGKQIDWSFTSAYRRTHVRTSSADSIGLVKRGAGINNSQFIVDKKDGQEEIICTLEETKSAHQQPITSMEVVNGMIFTGSKDHTLRVFNMYDSNIEFTLHGHFGPITCLFVDKWQHGSGGSGSQDGLLCIWDLYTGACMYNIQAHDGSISSLACAPSYVISLGIDERVCVWERFQGNLLTTINISNAYSNLCMLTPSLLVTSKLGSLIVWDVRSGEPAREVKLGSDFSQICPKIMILANSSIICDYGNQIRIVKFPIVADKSN